MRQNVVQTDSAVVRRNPAQHRHQVGAQNQQASAVRNQNLAGGGRVSDYQAERGETGRRKLKGIIIDIRLAIKNKTEGKFELQIEKIAIGF